MEFQSRHIILLSGKLSSSLRALVIANSKVLQVALTSCFNQYCKVLLKRSLSSSGYSDSITSSKLSCNPSLRPMVLHNVQYSVTNLLRSLISGLWLATRNLQKLTTGKVYCHINVATCTVACSSVFGLV